MEKIVPGSLGILTLLVCDVSISQWYPFAKKERVNGNRSQTKELANESSS